MSNEKVDVHIHIDLNEVSRVIRTAINEAAIYAGFSYNIKKDRNFINFDLVEDSSIRFVPNTTSPEAITLYKEYLYNWVIHNSFKYVVDRFSIFLEEIHHVCTLYTFYKRKNTQEVFNQVNSIRNSFHDKNFNQKLLSIKNEFNITPFKSNGLISLQYVRNCLTHRGGIVGKKDLKNNNELKVIWSGYYVFAKDSSGKEYDLTNIPTGGFNLSEDMDIMFKQHAYKEKSFKENDRISFSTREFSEILLYVRSESDFILKEVLKFAESKGIPVVNKDETNNS